MIRGQLYLKFNFKDIIFKKSNLYNEKCFCLYILSISIYYLNEDTAVIGYKED